MADDNTLDGGCTCGAIRYRLKLPPLIVHCCHCHWCQRETGGAFALNAMIEAERVSVLEGEPIAVLTPSNSGKGQIIWRCPECHVALWSNYSGAGKGIHFVRVGTLDDVDRLSPDIHIFTASKLPWVEIPAGHYAVKHYYNREKYWSDESLARWKLLSGMDS